MALKFSLDVQLSSSLRESGFAILPIDHKAGKLMKAKLTLLDLTKHADINILFSILNTANRVLPLGSSVLYWQESERDPSSGRKGKIESRASEVNVVAFGISVTGEETEDLDKQIVAHFQQQKTDGPFSVELIELP